MTDERRPVYCGSCGSMAYSTEKFCGTCGAAIPPDAQPATPTEEIPTLVQPPPTAAPPRGTGRRLPRWLVPVALLVVMVASTGALAYAALGPGDDTERQSPEAGVPPVAEEEPTSASVSPDSPPDPAFNLLLPELRRRTSVPIVLPATLPDELDKPAIDPYVDGVEEYGIVFPFGPTEVVAEGVSNAETLGTLTAYPEGEDRANEFFDAEKIEEVVLPDGTEATLRYMVPAGRAGSQGPFWEGKFDKDGYTYDLMVVKPYEISEDEVKQALSSMVPVEGSGGEAADTPEQNSDEERLEEFGYEYDEANRREDWEATYAMLGEESRQEFTEEEWAEKQQVVRDANGTPAALESVAVELEEGVSDAPGTVTLNYEDGTQEDLTVTTFRAVDGPNDDGGPRMILSDVAIAYLKGAEDAARPGAPTPQREVFEGEAEAAAGDYYRAAGVQDWNYTYDNLDSETKGLFTREEWIQKNRWFADQGKTIYNIESVELDETAQEPLAEVSVRLTGEDGSSSIRTTYFVNEDGFWKHRFGREETDLFEPGVPFKEFVEAREG